ncbi:MAG: putative lipid II flippase FtsW [Tissierella sp.]|nr:putative lipid II flippase FtsW [Tissierella sp.]
MARKKKTEKKKAVDFTLFLSIMILVFIGIIMVFSASWPEAMQKFDNGYHFLTRQMMFAGLGFFVLIVLMNIDYRYYKKFALPIFIMAIILGLLIFSPLGVEQKGARRWIEIVGFRFMPSDIIKFASIVFFSAFLSNKKERISTLIYGTVPALIIIGISCGLIYFQKDLGTTVTLAGTMMAMFFIAGMRLSHLFTLGVGAGGLLYFAITSEGNEYRLERVTAFIDPFADKLDTGWQAVQSLYAIGSGGLFGLGLGKSRQKFFYIPESYNDFIFSIIGEELGFLGALLVMLLLLIVIWRGIVIALKVEDTFGCFLATGIIALIAIQSLIHIAVVTSSIPTTGITLPFVSYGGTSLVMNMAAIGVLLNISRHANLERS